MPVILVFRGKLQENPWLKAALNYIAKDSLNYTVQPCLKKSKDGGVAQW